MELRRAIDDAFCFRPGETDGDRLMRISATSEIMPWARATREAKKTARAIARVQPTLAHTN